MVAGAIGKKPVVGRISVGAREALAGAIGTADATTIGRARGSGALVLIGLAVIFAEDCADLFFALLAAAGLVAFGFVLVLAAPAFLSGLTAAGFALSDGAAGAGAPMLTANARTAHPQSRRRLRKIIPSRVPSRPVPGHTQNLMPPGNNLAARPAPVTVVRRSR